MPAEAMGNVSANKALIAMLDAADYEYFEDAQGDQEVADEQVIGKRRAARQMLLRACPGNWQSDEIVHHCAYSVGCGCQSDDEAKAFVFGLLDEIALRVRPCIPALNRWNKLYGPIAWWAFAIGFHNIIGRAVCSAKADIADLSDPSSILGELVDLDVGGPESDVAYRAVKSIRLIATYSVHEGSPISKIDAHHHSRM
jgi:hypothetical protein